MSKEDKNSKSKKDKTSKSNKAIKCRIYPTKDQQTLLAKTFGCCRKVGNLMLHDKIEHYKEHKVMLNNTPAQYKKDNPYKNIHLGIWIQELPGYKRGIKYKTRRT